MTFFEYSSLVSVLNGWTEKYAAGAPEVGDATFDAEYRRMKQFEAENPGLILDTSPSRKVSDGASGFRKVRHEVPMISISNANGIDEAKEWSSGMKRDHGVGYVTLEYKIDGLGLALIYRDGVLCDAVTRGKDNVGDSVWENALRVKGIPRSIAKPGLNEIRGEVVWMMDDFDRYCDRMQELGKKAPSNPRNGAAGILKSHSPDAVESAGLSFIAYTYARGSSNGTQNADLEEIASMGFTVEDHSVVDAGDIEKTAEAMRAKRYSLPFPIDGVVIKVDDKSLYGDIGSTGKSPNYYRAYKFPPEEKETTVTRIIESAGRTGAITPVAEFNEIHLAMTTVSRCSLHNWDVVDYMGIRAGSRIVVRKAGEIIPEVVRCLDTGRTKDEYEVLRAAGTLPPVDTSVRPARCPYCGGPLSRQMNSDGTAGVAWVCTDENCGSRIVERLIHFASRECMNIRGWGESVMENLVDAGKVKSFGDLYRLTADDLKGLGNIRDKGAAKLIASMEASRSGGLHMLISGLSIPNVGHTVSPLIARTLGSLRTASPDELVSAGVPELAAKSYCGWASANSAVIDDLRALGVAPVPERNAVSGTSLAGQTCIMTGTFDWLDREDFKRRVVSLGGKICSSITKKTTLVLMGDNAGPKKVSAIDGLKSAGYGIRVLGPGDRKEIEKLLEIM